MLPKRRRTKWRPERKTGCRPAIPTASVLVRSFTRYHTSIGKNQPRRFNGADHLEHLQLPKRRRPTTSRYVETLWRHSSSELLSFQCHQWWWELLCKQRRRRKNRGGQLLTFCVLCEIIPRGKKNNNLTAEEDIYLWMFQKPLFHPLPFCSCFVYILIWRKKLCLLSLTVSFWLLLWLFRVKITTSSIYWLLWWLLIMTSV